MQRELALSIALHVAIVVAAYVGLPSLRPDNAPMTEAALSVELVDVAETSNLPPAPSPKPEVKPVPEPKPHARAPEPVKREQPPPATPPAPPVPEVAATSEPEPSAPPPPEPVAVAEAPPEREPAEPAPEAEPPPTPVFAPKRKAEAPPRPVAEPKPEPEQAVARAKPKPPEQEAAESAPKKPPAPAKAPVDVAKPKPKEELDFAAVLKSLESTKRQAAPGPAATGATGAESDAADATSKSASTSYDPGLPVTTSEIDAVRRQIEQCWNLPAGARDAPDLRVTIVVDMNADGTPRHAVIDDQAQTQSDPYFRVAAESALRAVLNPRCHPFRLPREKYERWKVMTLVFDPREMFGT